MKSAQAIFRSNVLFKGDFDRLQAIKPQLVFVFGPTAKLGKFGPGVKIATEFPEAVVIGCSTAGEISNAGVSDGSMVVNAIHFDDPSVRIVPFFQELKSSAQSFETGKLAASKIDKNGLRGICVISPGLGIDGARLVEGFMAELQTKSISVFGGLAGDGANFKETKTTLNGESYPDHVVGFAIYGDRLRVDSNYMGGWSSFGEPMQITKCAANVITRINNEPALNAYSRVVGDSAKDLPSSGLKFPLLVLENREATEGIVRTPLDVDRNELSITLAGSVAEGSWFRVMQTNLGDLTAAAEMAAQPLKKGNESSFALIVSCVGRKLVLNDRISDEISAIRRVFGENCDLAGFYSYGEICPDWEFKACSLHNETITISRFREIMS